MPSTTAAGQPMLDAHAAGRYTDASSRMRPHLCGLLPVALVAGIVLFSNLGGYALLDPDEGRHAEIAREALTATSWRGWIVPTLGGEPYYDKPMLFYWLAAGAYRLAGVTELGARLVSAFAALLTVLLTYAFGARAWGPRTGARGALVLATSIGFVGVGRLASTDMTLTLCTTASVVALGRWLLDGDDGASLVPAAIAAALGMLAKGLVAPALVTATVLVFLTGDRSLRRLGRARLGPAIAAFAAVAVPWYVAAGLVDPDYVRTFFLRHHLGRIAGEAVRSHAEPPYYYVPVIAIAFLPWSVFLPAVLHAALGRARRGRVEILCACWAGAVLALFSLAGDKLPTYVLPALPPLALLTGRGFDLLVAGADPRARRLAVAGGFAAAVGLAAGAFVLRALGTHAYEGALRDVADLALAGVAAGGVLAGTLALGRLRLAFGTLVAIVVGLAVLLFERAAPAIGDLRSAAPLARVIARHAPSPEVPVLRFEVRAPSLLFYLRRPAPLVRGARQICAERERRGLVLVVTSLSHASRLDRCGPWHSWYASPRLIVVGSEPAPFS